MTVKQHFYEEMNANQVRVACMRHAIAGPLAREATTRLFHEGVMNASLYVIDTLTNKGARITYTGWGFFDVKISTDTGEGLLARLCDLEIIPGSIDNLVIID
jgi:hypothetical protein